MVDGRSQDPVIEVQDLVAYYGARRILDGISLTVNDGEIMVIMGGSGSGKYDTVGGTETDVYRRVLVMQVFISEAI